MQVRPIESAGLAVSGVGADVRQELVSRRAANFLNLQKRVSALIKVGVLPVGTRTDSGGSLLVPGQDGRVQLKDFELTAASLGIKLP